jgi:peptide/nickel transport system permease protein
LLKYAIRKLILAIPLIIGVVTFIFVLVELSPGDISDKFFTPETPPQVRDAIIAKYQLDQPSYVRYLAMMKNLLFLDFGRSMAQEKPVFEIILGTLPNTILLSVVTLFVIYPTGILVGSLQAIRHNTVVDTTLSITSLVLYSMPSFWLALMLQLLVGFYYTGWVEDLVAAGTISDVMGGYLSLPLSGMQDDMLQYSDPSTLEIVFDRMKHLLLPGIAMGLASAGSTARYMRSALLETIRQDYIRTARAKGLRERTVIMKHAMRNAMLPVITLMGLSVPFLFSGAVLTEVVFAWPGMGRLILTAIYTQDTPLIIACFFIFTVLVVAGNLIADLTYALVDPRIKYD